MKNFSVGAQVEIKTRFKSNVLGVEYDEPVFTGKVLANPKWLDNDYVCLYTGNPDFPISHIHKRFIIGFDFPENRSEYRVFKVTSKTKGNTYNVISENGLVSCDCVGFQFRRQCKHSNKVKEFIQNA
jgi:hypothetical protein